MLRITHRSIDPALPSYVTCDTCGYYAIGELLWAESIDGLDCPACSVTDEELDQLQLVELSDGTGWTVGAVE